MAHIQKIKLKGGIAHQVQYMINGVRTTHYFPPSIPLKDVKKFAKEMEVKAYQTQQKLILKKVSLSDLLGYTKKADHRK
jgi:hypothetical protein